MCGCGCGADAAFPLSLEDNCGFTPLIAICHEQRLGVGSDAVVEALLNRPKGKANPQAQTPAGTVDAGTFGLSGGL